MIVFYKFKEIKVELKFFVVAFLILLFSFSQNNFKCIDQLESFRCNCPSEGFTQPFCNGMGLVTYSSNCSSDLFIDIY